MTASLRNSLHRRNHKERSQLTHRAKLGILEKHKDYVQRARDYHSKQDRLTRLKQKAAEKNKDEFYFSMNKEKTKGGVHVKDRGNVALPTDIVKVLKTQDENYVRTMRMSNQKKIDKLRMQLMTMTDLMKPLEDEEGLEDTELETLRDAGIISGPSKKRSRRHIVWVDDEAAAQKSVEKLQSREDDENIADDASPKTEDIDLGWIIPEKKRKSKKRKSRASDAEKVDEDMGDEDLGESTSVLHRRRLFKELSARLVRDQQLQYAEREFELQRAMMGKGARRKIIGPEKVGDDDDSEDEDALDARGGRARKSARGEEPTYKPRVYKWRVERKR